jgi:hypothetical protein
VDYPVFGRVRRSVRAAVGQSTGLAGKVLAVMHYLSLIKFNLSGFYRDFGIKWGWYDAMAV